MRADFLLDHFHLLVRTFQDAPRLEAAILNLAVHGQLVSQFPGDEPATELLRRIRAERKRFTLERSNSEAKPLPAIEDEEIPYPLPSSWVWCRLPDIYHGWEQCKPQSDFTYIDVSSINNLLGVISDDLAVLSPHEAPSRARKRVQSGTVIYSTVRPYLLNVAVVDRDYEPTPIASTAFEVMHPFEGVFNKYLYYYLRSQPFTRFVESQMTGMAYPAISTSKLSLGLFPLPPLAEQKRIVARVDELLAQTRALAAQLEKADKALVPTARASFQALADARDNAAQRDAWQRINEAFDALTADPRTLDALKQTVLHLAVRGKLVPQDPNDEPVSRLIERMRAERTELVRAREAREGAVLTPISPAETPFSAPSTWEFIRLGDLARFIDYRGRTPPKTDSGLPLITAKNVKMGYIDPQPREYVDPAIYERWMTRGIPRKGDVLFTTEAPLGNVALLPSSDKRVLAQRIIALHPYADMNPSFLMFALMSTPVRRIIFAKATGTTARGIKASRLKRIVIPVPPLDEQKRIAAKVESLLALIDALGTEVETAEKVRERLLGAVLNGD